MTGRPHRVAWIAAILTTSAITGVQAQQPAPAAPAPTLGAAPPVTSERLLNVEKEPQNWLTYHYNYSSHRYSPLKEVTRGNVANLKMAFTFALGATQGGGNFKNAALEGTPLVNNGFMYITSGWGDVFKLNVLDGYAKPLWRMDPATDKDWAAGMACCDIDNRGVGLWKDKVVSHTLDGRIVLTDDASGKVVWQERRANPDAGETITAAPLVIKDLAITGMSGAEKGVRGWLSATDLNTGKEVWRTYTIPGPGEPGHETWADSYNAWKTGGAATWGNGSYDPQLNLIYWGTANPGPDFDPEYRPGRNLYSDSMLAFDLDTGKIKWWFQYTPNDPHDHDEIGEQQIIDVTVGGEPRKIIVHAARNGFFYALDRTNGQFMFGSPYLDKVTWTKGLDPKTGLPVEYDPNKQVQLFIPETTGLRNKPPTAQVCPSTGGGKNWQPAAYNPELHRLYIPAMESCGMITAKEQDKPVAEGGKWKLPASFTGTGGVQQLTLTGSLTAKDVTTGQTVKKINTPYPMWGGVLATAGGLVFTSTIDGWVKAFDSDTLAELWKFNVGAGINAPPMTYAVNGKQYIAILVGSVQDAGYRGNLDAHLGLQPASTLYVFSL